MRAYRRRQCPKGARRLTPSRPRLQTQNSSHKRRRRRETVKICSFFGFLPRLLLGPAFPVKSDLGKIVAVKKPFSLARSFLHISIIEQEEILCYQHLYKDHLDVLLDFARRIYSFLGILRRLIAVNTKNPPFKDGAIVFYKEPLVCLFYLLVWAIWGSLFPWINWHHLRLSLPPTSRISLKALIGLRKSSSRPSAAGIWSRHHRVSRISFVGSVFGSQPGQYGLATFGDSIIESDIGTSPFCSWFKLKKNRLRVNILGLLETFREPKIPQ